MKVSKGTTHITDIEARSFNNKTMQEDFEYVIASKLTKELLINGLISTNEAEEINKLNKKTFKPFYKELMD